MLETVRSFLRNSRLAVPVTLGGGALASVGIFVLALAAMNGALGASSEPKPPIEASTATLLGVPPGFEIVDDDAGRDIQTFVEVARISDFAAYAQFVAYAEAVERLEAFARLAAYGDAVARLEREEAERLQAAAAPPPVPRPRPAAGAPPASAPVAPRPTPTPAPPPVVSTAGLDTAPMSALERGLFDAINRRRASSGLHALRANPALVGVARIRSRDMAANGYFAHTSPVTGDDAFTLMNAYGIPYAWAGENLAMNNYPAGECVAVADEALWNSPPHRQNSLGSNYADMGVAVATTASGMHYFTVIFTGQ